MVAPGARMKGSATGRPQGSGAEDFSRQHAQAMASPMRLYRTSSTTSLSGAPSLSSLTRTTSTTSLTTGYTSDAPSDHGAPRLHRTVSRSAYVSSAPFADSNAPKGPPSPSPATPGRRAPTPDLSRRQTVFLTETMNKPATQVTTGLALTEHVTAGRLGPGHASPGHRVSGGSPGPGQKRPAHVVRVAKAPCNDQFRPSTAQKQARDVFCSGAPLASAGTGGGTAMHTGQTIFRVETTNGSSKARAARQAVAQGAPHGRTSPMHHSTSTGDFGARGAGGAKTGVPGMSRPKTSQGPLYAAAGTGKSGPARPGTSGARVVSAGPVVPGAKSALCNSKSWNDVTATGKPDSAAKVMLSKSDAQVETQPAIVAPMDAGSMAEIEEFEDCMLEIDLSADSEKGNLVLPPALKAVHNTPGAGKAATEGSALAKADSALALGKESQAVHSTTVGIKKVASFPWLGIGIKAKERREAKAKPVSALMESESAGKSERPPSRGFTFRGLGSWQKAKV